jgi:putative hydrolase of the HAD superfamily
MNGEIKAVLFDSGGTLLRPIGGAWWPRPVLRRMLQKSGTKIAPNQLDDAHQRGMRFLDLHHHLSTEEEEVAQFKEFYAIVLAELRIVTDAPTIEELALAEIRELIQEPFPETRAVLEDLREKSLRLGIVSNAWPSLDRTYRMLGLRDFFGAFVVSAKLGCMKPDLRILLKALEELGATPEETLFVDDFADNVRAAESLGMRGAVICREGAEATSMRTIASLAEVTEMAGLR